MTKCLGITWDSDNVSLKVFWPCWATWEVPWKIQNYVSLGHSDSSRQGWLQAQDTVGSIRTCPVLFTEVMGNEKALLGEGASAGSSFAQKKGTLVVNAGFSVGSPGLQQ